MRSVSKSLNESLMHHYIPSFIETIASALIIALSLFIAFVSMEPIAIDAQTQDQFTVSQTITGEVSFLVNATDVTLTPSLSGITGGTSNGGTQVRIHTNDTSGYSLTLKASSSLGMIGNVTSDVIPALASTSAGVPDFGFDSTTVAVNTARFAYTVEASSTTDLDPSFRDNGSVCNTGAIDTVDKCWLNSSTTNETIINRSTSTPASGSTTTLKFRVVLQSNPAPALSEDIYVSTTTLTATTN